MEATSIPAREERVRRAATSQNAPLVALGVILVAGFALFVGIATKLTFYQDTWDFLLNRRAFTVDALMTPHNEHIVLVPVLLQQLYLGLFGMSTAMPEYVGEAILLVVTAWLVFVYSRRRVGDWAAVIVTALLLFIGAAWETLLWPFEVCFVGPILFGVAMLLMLEREDRKGDILACLFLGIAIAFNSLGVAFIAAGAVEILQRPSHRDQVLSRSWMLEVLRRVWIIAIPAILYFLWYEKWGTQATAAVTMDNFLSSPRYMLDCLAANLEALCGLAAPGDAGLGWGRPLAILALALVAIAGWRRGGFFSRIWPPLATLLAYWFLLALNHDAAREPNTSRYLYAGVALLLVVAVNVMEGVRPRPRLLLVGAGVAAITIFSNLGLMKHGADYLHEQAVLTKNALGAMEIARPVIDPSYMSSQEESGTAALFGVSAGQYFEAVDEDGSPAFSPTDIAESTPPVRHNADVMLGSSEQIELTPGAGGWSASPPPGRKCATFEGSNGTEVQLAPGVNTVEVAPGPEAHLYLRRFATGEFPVALDGVEGGSAADVKIPTDTATASYPWSLDVEGGQTARVCLPR